MKTITSPFQLAYQSYYDFIHSKLEDGFSILEIGGGAHPSIKDRQNMSYTIVDPDKSELAKAPENIKCINAIVQQMDKSMKYDLIISKMVLEHVEDPDTFHNSVQNLLSDSGKVIHFFACRHSLPALVNRLLPESFGDSLLRLLNNRDLTNEPKYKAYYKKTKGHTYSQLRYFKKLGYSVQTYHSFVGHKYFKNAPILKMLERGYTHMLHKLNLYQLATVAIIILEKKKIN